MLIKLAWRSLLNRRLAVMLAILSVAVSLMVLLAVEQVRQQTRSGFQQSASGVDLIIGARTGPVNLLLYSVFRLGSPTDNMSWQAYQKIAEHPQVAWAIPVALGDSHRGYRVLGTTEDYFAHFRYGRKQSLGFISGGRFDDLYDVVLGHDVARRLGYKLGDSLVLSH
ncbi:MAG TPA: ABC transporter permease, partial [Cellvibrionaceae bacterium]